MNDPSEKGTGEDSESQLLWAHPEAAPPRDLPVAQHPYPNTDPHPFPSPSGRGTHRNREGGEDPVSREALVLWNLSLM